jgi:rare lipoprotein A
VMAPQQPRVEPVLVPEPAPAVEPVVEAPLVDPAPAPKPEPRPSIAGAQPRLEHVPRGSPNVPYVVKGIRYEPYNSDVPMRDLGIASWYGQPFHGRKTANGERYDMHGMTAAHKTMPLPSYAVVRNRRNGKEIVVRVNDRGPFKPGRVIDLSFAAARELGISASGLGNVEVVRLTNAVIAQGSWRNRPSDNATVAKADAGAAKR